MIGDSLKIYKADEPFAEDGVIYSLGPANPAIYQTKQELMWAEAFHGCRCGNPEVAHAFALEVLKQSINYPTEQAPYEYASPGVDGIAALCTAQPQAAALLIAYMMDHLGMTEHGGSVYGTWLSDLGKQALEIGPMVDEDPETEVSAEKLFFIENGTDLTHWFECDQPETFKATAVCRLVCIETETTRQIFPVNDAEPMESKSMLLMSAPDGASVKAHKYLTLTGARKWDEAIVEKGEN